MELEGVKELSILEELRSYFSGVKGVMELKELSHYSVLTFFSRWFVGIWLLIL